MGIAFLWRAEPVAFLTLVARVPANSALCTLHWVLLGACVCERLEHPFKRAHITMSFRCLSELFATRAHSNKWVSLLGKMFSQMARQDEQKRWFRISVWVCVSLFSSFLINAICPLDEKRPTGLFNYARIASELSLKCWLWRHQLLVENAERLFYFFPLPGIFTTGSRAKL